MSTATGLQYDITIYPMRAFLVVLEIGEEKETIVFSSQFQALLLNFILKTENLDQIFSTLKQIIRNNVLRLKSG